MSWQKAGVLAIVSSSSSEPCEVISFGWSPRCKGKIRAHISVKQQEASMQCICKDSLKTFSEHSP